MTYLFAFWHQRPSLDHSIGSYGAAEEQSHHRPLSLEIEQEKGARLAVSVLMPWPLCSGSRWCLIHFRSFLEFGLIIVVWAIHFCFLGTRLCRSLSIRSRSQYSLSLVNLFWASVRTEWLTRGTVDVVWSGAQFTGSVTIRGVTGGMVKGACSGVSCFLC